MESILAVLSQPNQLDAVSRRVKMLLSDLDKTTTAGAPNGRTTHLGSTSRGHSSDHQDLDDPSSSAHQTTTTTTLDTNEREKIDALYAALPRIEPMLPLVPPLLTRLRSLASLHAGASSFESTLKQCEVESDKMRETDETMTLVMKRLEKGMEEQVETIKGNWDSLSERIVRLEDRLTRLDEAKS